MSDMETMKKALMKQLHLVIESFFKSVSDDTWMILMGSSLDGSTRDKLEQLLWEVTVTISNKTIALFNNKKWVSEEDVLFIWDHIVPETFARVLDVSDVSCEITDDLNKLIIAEVVRSVNAAIIKGKKTAETTLFQHQLGTDRLDTIVDQADKMLKYYYMCSPELCEESRTSKASAQSADVRRVTPPERPFSHQLTGETVRTLVTSFFIGLRPKQKAALMSGTPDGDTTDRLEALLELITALLLDRLKSSGVSEKDVLSVLGNIVPRAFAEVLGVPGQVTHEGADLTNIIVKEVAESINFPVTKKRSTRKFNVMVPHALTMFQEYSWGVDAAPVTAGPPGKHIALGGDFDDDDDDDNKPLLDEQKTVCESKGVHRQPEESKKVRQAKKEVREMQKELEEQKSIIQKAKKDADDAKAVSEQKKLKEDGKEQNEKAMRKLEEVLEELEEEIKELQATKAEAAELLKKLQETNENMLEKKNLQMQQSDMQTDCNEIKKLLKQREKLEKKLLEAKEKEAKKQMKKPEDEERQRQKIKEKEAKKEQKRREKEAKKVKTQQQNEKQPSCLWWLCCFCPNLPDD